MPLGAFRINSLAKVQIEAGVDVEPRTSESMFIDEQGNMKISTAQNKFGGSSILGDGTGDYLDIQDVGNNLDFGTGDFTIEWFQYLTSLDRFAIDMRNGSNGAKILLYSYQNDGSASDLYLYVNSGNRITATGCLSANQWQHIALVRESSTTTLYVDGSQVGSTYSDSNNYAHDEILIWENSLSLGNYTPPGYIDEFRISKGHARYSGASLTVPTSAFTKDEHTHLLIHGDGDNNSTVILDDGVRTDAAVTVAMVSNAHISTDQAKFGSTSVELDGTDDAVDPDHTQLNIGSGDFTVEFFYYPTDLSTVYGRYFFDTGSGVSGRLNGYFNSSSQFVVRSGNTELLKASHGMSTGQWYHLAIVRKNGTLKFYRDGTELASTSNSTNFTNNDYKIGSYLTGGGFGLIGYIDEFRQSDVARYSQAFTAPTSAFVADGNTKLLLHFEGSNNDTTTTDDGPRATSTWSNGAWSTTTGKFDTGFTMTNNSSPGSVTLPTGFELDDDQTITVEFWFKASVFGNSGTNSTKIFSTAPIDDNSYETASGHITIHIWNGALYLNGNLSSETTLASAGSGSGTTWYHIAFQYDGTNNLRCWLDGVHKANVTHNCNGFSTLYWGNMLSGQGSQSGTNYIDEIRISKVNRYTHSTTNFTAPTSAFTNDDNTLALFHCETTTQTDDNS